MCKGATGTGESPAAPGRCGPQRQVLAPHALHGDVEGCAGAWHVVIAAGDYSQQAQVGLEALQMLSITLQPSFRRLSMVVSLVC